MQNKELLESCDKLLDEIKVSGNDVFTLARARQYLKLAYDNVLNEVKNEAPISTDCE